MSKSLKSLKIFEYRFQRFLGSKKTDSLYRDLLNNIFNVYIFEYLSSLWGFGESGHQRKKREELLKLSKIRFFRSYLIDTKMFISLSTLLKDFQRTQRFTFWRPSCN
jgi:hypothetical protein